MQWHSSFLFSYVAELCSSQGYSFIFFYVSISSTWHEPPCRIPHSGSVRLRFDTWHHIMCLHEHQALESCILLEMLSFITRTIICNRATLRWVHDLKLTLLKIAFTLFHQKSSFTKHVISRNKSQNTQVQNSCMWRKGKGVFQLQLFIYVSEVYWTLVVVTAKTRLISTVGGSKCG